MSIFANDNVPIQKILACQSALEAATLINEHYHFSVGYGAGKSLHTFTPIERKLVSLILQAAQQVRAADACPVCEGKRQDPAFSQIPVKCPACGGTGQRG